jgi:hypothetical protein
MMDNFCRAVPNPNITIRIFFIAVRGGRRRRRSARPHQHRRGALVPLLQRSHLLRLRLRAMEHKWGVKWEHPYHRNERSRTAMQKLRIVWCGATENGPLNDGQIPNSRVVRVHVSTGSVRATVVERGIGGRRETAS